MKNQQITVYKCPLCQLDQFFNRKIDLTLHLTHGYAQPNPNAEFEGQTYQQWEAKREGDPYFHGQDTPNHKGYVWWNHKNQMVIKLNDQWQVFRPEKFKIKIQKDCPDPPEYTCEIKTYTYNPFAKIEHWKVKNANKKTTNMEK